MRRFLVASFLGTLLTASTAVAADQEGITALTPSIGTAVISLVPKAETAAAATPSLPRAAEFRRPSLLPALYSSAAILQGYDAYSTLTVLKHGGVEANPFMKGITKNPAAFVGLKAGVATMSILAAERMWKNHNRVGAVLTMVASNSVMAMVAANNARVMSQVRK